MKWEIIESGRRSPAEIMDLDFRLLHRLQVVSHPVLHLYEWEGNCLTYGYFINPYDYLDASAIRDHQFRMARRPTGGGITFHTTDFAFSVLIPSTYPTFSNNTLANYAWINRKLIDVILSFSNSSFEPLLACQEDCGSKVSYQSFCMEGPTRYDVVVEGKKLAGAAQRRTKYGFLHQGSISLQMPSDTILKSVLKDKQVYENLKTNTFPLFGNLNYKDFTVLRDELREKLIHVFREYH